MRQQQGSVVLDKRRKTWNFYWWEDGKRYSKKIGTMSQYPTKAAAWRAAKPMRDMVESIGQSKESSSSPAVLTVNKVIDLYRAEKMPQRDDTRRSYDIWLRKHIAPVWGESALSDVQARPVELWLAGLSLAPKSKVHIRGMLRILWEFAMWRGEVPVQRNPMELVKIKCATKRVHRPRSLTVEEFGRFVQRLDEPFRTMALVSVCFGLRISETLALRWSDVDWLNCRLKVERAIVAQRVDEVKTSESRRALHIDPHMIETLKAWKQRTEFSGQDDWMFASPVQLGRLPWSYDQVWRAYQKAGAEAGIGGLGTHSLRHTYRSWLDAVGTSIAVQQKLMRHADIRTTMNIYGDVVTGEMAEANAKVARLAINGTQAARGTS